MNEKQVLRIAFERPEDGVAVMTVAELQERAARAEDRSKYERAEYVEADSSPYWTWEAIRAKGYSCRAFIPWRVR